MANDFQSKIGEGLSKFQGGIEQGKQKLQVTQEMNRLRKMIQELSVKKSAVLLELGQVTYKQIRAEAIAAEELVTISDQLVSLDKQIYLATKQLSEMNKTEDNAVVCGSCNEANGPNDKFCGSCGTPLEKPAEVDLSEGISCVTCEEIIPKEANFCPCCGSKSDNKTA
ncbi:zinc ribbon domain-containing protein [Bacillus alkalicellulosilyticus]|uniref:zinc ribbon domain-containing protein n=1 Tax=Alkalihalobacterium alkalicellulosilyticum TaxID=1912214 RepID=UPI0009966B25|nr:zinc ribbon domain-containing protein [Bacillus alkalicellulosilyticus]